MMVFSKMLGLSFVYVIFTVFVWHAMEGKKYTNLTIAIIGVLYGFGAILSTHFGVNYDYMMLNVRDIGPLAAGLFFHPMSGLIAGFVGGIERYIAGTYFGIGSYTTVACSISTCLAGAFAWVMHKYFLKGEKPTPAYAFFIGATMEVFHMYAVFITHTENMQTAFYVVSKCSIPMIVFTAIGMGLTSCAILMLEEKWTNPFKRQKRENISITKTFQKALFICTFIVIAVSFAMSFLLQTQSAYQYAKNELKIVSKNIIELYNEDQSLVKIRIGTSGAYSIYRDNGYVISGYNRGNFFKSYELEQFARHNSADYFRHNFFGRESLCRLEKLDDGNNLIVILPYADIFRYRDAQSYENGLASILLFTVVFFLISYIVKLLVIDNIDRVNYSLRKITAGNLEEKVEVRNSSEFAMLSDDLNATVSALKGYIADEKKRMAQELEFASSIQMSALPRNFRFPSRYEFEIYALMDAAKEVGGDFYDFFFIDESKFALVIADVSGKGIPAALFMMRSKTAIRSFAESSDSPNDILKKVNNVLCDGNDNEMFVTVWLGIIDLKNGEMVCANAGHEFPIGLSSDGNYEVFKDTHSLPLAAMEDIELKEYKVTLKPGDKVFVYTDGVPEAINSANEQYGLEKLIKTLNDNKSDSFNELLPKVRKDVSDFAGDTEQFDDITMLGFAFNNYLRDDLH